MTTAPLAVLLIGITGSGKTTLAQTLADHGMARLSVDEEVHRRHGRYGIDYPEDEYFEREAPVVSDIQRQLVELLHAGRDVVLDHGLWLRRQREAWCQLVEKAGGRCLPVYLPVGWDELLRRLKQRNQRVDANALTVTPEALHDFFNRFEPPMSDEHVITYTGELTPIEHALRQ